MEEKKFKFSTVFLVLIILIIIVGIAYLFIQNMELTNKQEQGEKQIQTLQEKIQEFENKISDTNTVTENQVQQPIEQNNIQNNNIAPTQTQTQTQAQTTQTIDYTGTYKRTNGDTAIISKDIEGNTIISFNNNNYKSNIDEKRNDGSVTIFDSKDELDRWFIYYYPAGANLALAEKEGDPEQNYKASDNTKIRLIFNGSSQEFLSDIFYKVN